MEKHIFFFSFYFEWIYVIIIWVKQSNKTTKSKSKSSNWQSGNMLRHCSCVLSDSEILLYPRNVVEQTMRHEGHAGETRGNQGWKAKWVPIWWGMKWTWSGQRWTSRWDRSGTEWDMVWGDVHRLTGWGWLMMRWSMRKARSTASSRLVAFLASHLVLDVICQPSRKMERRASSSQVNFVPSQMKELGLSSPDFRFVGFGSVSNLMYLSSLWSCVSTPVLNMDLSLFWTCPDSVNNLGLDVFLSLWNKPLSDPDRCVLNTPVISDRFLDYWTLNIGFVCLSTGLMV